MEREYSTYLFEYFHNDSWWAITICASSEEDARARMKKLPLAKFLGTVQGKIPAQFGWLARLVCWWKNLALLKENT